MIDKDDQIIYFASEFHLVTRAHLAQLTGRNVKSLNESLRRLVRQQRLYCKKQGIYKPHVYATYDITRRQDFDHDLRITDVHLSLYKTGRLLEWNQPKQKLKGEVNEDAVFWLAVPLPKRVGRIKYYFEYDTGIEPLWQIDNKLKRYIKLSQQNMEPFHVLFVCKEKDRVERLILRAQCYYEKDKLGEGKFFLFSWLQNILTDVQGAICQIVFDEIRYPLAPCIQHSAKLDIFP